MKKIMYSLMLGVIVFAFASCGAEDLLTEKAIKFSIGGKNYSFSKYPSAIATKLGGAYQLIIMANSDENVADIINFTIADATNANWASQDCTVSLTLGGDVFVQSGVRLSGIKITGEIAVQTLVAGPFNAELVGTAGSKTLTGVKINVYYTNNAD
ncbi:MAG: hypothetical protein LBC99_09420 [Spirochaetota bacterium]|jgi:hypothetical protein|nr:hypothetical protein [Spirochaetota bacterium]